MARTTQKATKETLLSQSFPELGFIFSADPRWEGTSVVVRSVLGIGREGGPGDLVVDDPRMSRRHARFTIGKDGETVFVADLGSRNGTSVNGQKIAEQCVALSPGDIVRLGDTIAHFRTVEEPSASSQPSHPRIVGASRAVQEVVAAAHRVAKGRRLPVLILGETGTGKELVAREIHEASGRRGPFVAVNCAAIPANLIESSFFGHRKGSFSGAIDDQEGYFAAAREGTLFLDEIGELPVDVQAKLLRAIEMMEVTPVGETRPHRIATAIVAATNRRLYDEVRRGSFRADLLARLAGVSIALPPIRSRREDILVLFNHFVARESVSVRMTADFVEALVLNPWPQNIRQLEHLAKRLAIDVAPGASLGAREARRLLPAVVDEASPIGAPTPADEAAGRSRERTRPSIPPRDELVRVLEMNGGNIAAVANHFQSHRQQVYRWIEYLDIDLAATRGRRS